MNTVVQSSEGESGVVDLGRSRFLPGVCAGEDLAPDYGHLDENQVVQFLERQHMDVRLERPRADLSYVVISGAGASSPVRLRVAILADADQAGRDLHEAILQHGEGSWGVHRSNVAILGPIASEEDALAFAAQTKLACWGVFTIAGRDDTFVVPGAYVEL
ncbi:MAG TPA: hypothetical protein VHU80_11595 [Polyangiaceae bacterium]|nr:hypothetical protein [Polyangiaceae bacterium]